MLGIFYKNNGINASVTNQLVYGNEEGGTNHKNGLQVRLTFTMKATGMVAATFITVTGLNERELPKSSNSDGVMHIAIPGLCIGTAQDLRHEAVEYLALYRKESCHITNHTSEERNFRFYRRHVLQPFIDLCREKMDGW